MRSAHSILQALATGRKLKELTREAIKGLDNMMKARNCPMFGAPGVHPTFESWKLRRFRRQ